MIYLSQFGKIPLTGSKNIVGTRNSCTHDIFLNQSMMLSLTLTPTESTLKKICPPTFGGSGGIVFNETFDFLLTTVRTTWPGCFNTHSFSSIPNQSDRPSFKCLKEKLLPVYKTHKCPYSSTEKQLSNMFCSSMMSVKLETQYRQ